MGVAWPNPWADTGEGNVHSRVLHSQGFALAFRPLNMLQNNFTRNITCTAIVTTAAIVINRCNGSMAETYCTPVSSEERLGCPAAPRRCIGIKIAYAPRK